MIRFTKGFLEQCYGVRQELYVQTLRIIHVRISIDVRDISVFLN